MERTERRHRLRSMTHDQVVQLYIESSADTLTARDADEAAAHWFRAESCHLELIRRHSKGEEGRCRDDCCMYWPWG